MAFKLKVKHRGSVGQRIINDRFGQQHNLTPGAEVEVELIDAEAQHFVNRSNAGDDLEVTEAGDHFDEKAADEKAKTQLPPKRVKLDNNQKQLPAQPAATTVLGKPAGDDGDDEDTKKRKARGE
jgi:hypothetical protein